MKSGASSTVIYEPGNNNTSNAITSLTDISSNLQQLRKYFIGIRPRTNPGDIWFQAKIGINESEDEFHANTSWWFQESQSAMFKKALQEHDTVRELWLLFSHQRMNLDDLTLAIEDYAGSNSIPTVQFALVQAAVKDGSKWSPTRKNEKPVKAIHIEVKKDDIREAKNMFSAIYGASAKSFPLDIRMRYVPSILPSTNTRTKKQIQDLRKKQEWFLASITHAQTWDIQYLDKVISPNTKSLREMMMNFKTKDKTSPLFLSINEDRRGDGFFVTFPTTIETEARDMLSHFGSYLVYEQKNKEVLKYLTLEAGERSKRALWDPETETAISEENTTMDELIVEVDNINWLQSPVQNKGVQFLENVSPPKNDERK